MNLGTTIKVAGGLLPPQLLERIAAGDSTLAGTAAADYHEENSVALNQAINRAWSVLTARWATFRTQLAQLPETDRATALTREKWLLPLFQELGYGRLAPVRSAILAEERTFAISHRWGHVPIHLVGARLSLDKRVAGERGAAASAPHGLVQDLLNHADEHLWAVVSNGLELRLLRDHRSLTRQAYISFDLEAVFDGEQFSAFRLLYLLCHQSRVEGDDPRMCWLERWVQHAQDDGVRALDRLRGGVEAALTALGRGFIRHRANDLLKTRLGSGALTTQDYYRQLLKLVYRLIFLFVAEDRDLLLVPDAPDAAKERFRRLYATRRLRTLAVRRRGGPHEDGWQALVLVMRQLDKGNVDIALPALGSFLWSTEDVAGKRVSRAIPDLDGASLANEDLYAALAALCVVQDGPVRRPVDWAGVQSDELGSVYEALMERVPRVNLAAGSFELAIAAGNERKTTGSYYTPSSLVDCLLDSALDPVLEQAARSAEPEKAILELSVVDPACGSGHFLVAAARRIAHRLARVRCGGIEPSPPEVQHALRDVVGHCIYGVDLNPMAVELCKVSLWMEAIEPGRPLSFLDGHVRYGNALLGATPELMEKGIPDEAWEAIEGDDKDVAKRLKKVNRNWKQTVLFVSKPAWDTTALAKRAAEVEAADDTTAAAVEQKEQAWRKLDDEASGARLLADLWCAAFVWPKQSGEAERAAPVRGLWESVKQAPASAPDATLRIAKELAEQYAFFHWHLAFPRVFERGGFDVVIGNPPYVDSETMERSSPVLRSVLARVWTCTTGNWDLFVPFVELAGRLVREDGIQAQVTPNKLIGSDYAADVQKLLLARKPLRIWDYTGHRMFVDAAIDVVIAAVQNLPGIHNHRVSFVKWGSGREGSATLGELRGLPSGYIGFPLSDTPTQFLELLSQARIRDVCSVGDGATTGEAYEIRKFVEEASPDAEDRADFVKLVNTGTIDPYKLAWGAQEIRYLGFVGRFPVIQEGLLSANFPRRFAQASRTKVVVAGLATRIEAAVAPSSWLCGKSAVQVIPDEAEICPYALCVVMNSDVFGAIYRGIFGMRGMGGASLNIGPRQLELMPIPPVRSLVPARESATEAFTLFSDPPAIAERHDLLSLIGKAMHAAFANGAASAHSFWSLAERQVRRSWGID